MLDTGVQMMTGRISSRQGLQVSAALGTKQLKKAKKNSPAKKLPVAPGSNRRGTAKGQGDGELLKGPTQAASRTLKPLIYQNVHSVSLIAQSGIQCKGHIQISVCAYNLAKLVGVPEAIHIQQK